MYAAAVFAMRLDSSSIIVAAQNHPAAAVGDETVILDPNDGRYYGINSVGSRIWQIIQTPTSVAEIRDRIVAEYAVEPNRCEADIITLAHQLLAAQLVQVQPGADSGSADRR